jgi:hypothetical protein
VTSATLLLIGCWAGSGSGCQMPQYGAAAAIPVANPISVRAQNSEALWERTVDVLHGFQFQVEREDRLTGVIETRYTTGSGCLEPWRHDSVGQANRLESTLQSIRRRVRVRLAPAAPGDGAYVVSVEAFKEKEDLVGLAANSPGAATFQEDAPLDRDLNPVVGQTAPSGWIPLGRDLALEQAILANLQAAYAG